jgi:hypothetical protein
MIRRTFIAGLGSATAASALPRAARAQKPLQTARVGILNYFDAQYPLVTEFTKSLRARWQRYRVYAWFC